MFDHKPVSIFLSGKTRGKKCIVKDSILNTKDLAYHVKSAVYECYLQHWTAGPNLDGTVTSADEIRILLTEIGRIMTLLNEIQLLEIRTAENGPNNLDELSIEGKRAEIELIFDEMPELEFFETLNLGCRVDVFFEALINCIKNNALSHQAYVFRLRGMKKNILKKRISQLKQNFNANTNLILESERELSALIEHELKLELQHYKKFENLNNERITPYFMNLVKTKNSSDSLD